MVQYCYALLKRLLIYRYFSLLFSAMDGFTTAAKEWLAHMANASTIVSLMIASTVGGAIVLKLKPQSCGNLFKSLQPHKLSLKDPKLPPKFNPFKEIGQQPEFCMIIEGPNKIGKTTLFPLSIPWWRQFGPFAYKGFVLNGAEAAPCEKFSEWRNHQMRGNMAYSGAELPRVLDEFRKKQWFRIYISNIFGVWKPKRAYIIVDQFEELVKKFPVEALSFANNLANDQVRNDLAFVFFVVNSKHGTKAILNLNQGQRFVVKEFTKSADVLNGAAKSDADRFEICQHNIGLLKEMEHVNMEELPEAVRIRMTQWKETYHLPFAPNGDQSWSLVDDRKFRVVLLRKVRSDMESRYVDDEAGVQARLLTDEKIKESLNILTGVLERLSKVTIRQKSAVEWTVLFESKTPDKSIAEDLTTTVMRVLATPADGSDTVVSG